MPVTSWWAAYLIGIRVNISTFRPYAAWGCGGWCYRCYFPAYGLRKAEAAQLLSHPARLRLGLWIKVSGRRSMGAAHLSGIRVGFHYKHLSPSTRLRCVGRGYWVLLPGRAARDTEDALVLPFSPIGGWGCAG